MNRTYAIFSTRGGDGICVSCYVYDLMEVLQQFVVISIRYLKRVLLSRSTGGNGTSQIPMVVVSSKSSGIRMGWTLASVSLITNQINRQLQNRNIH